MQKLKQELNANIVGAGPVSAHEKGITLIALIITIIVMLILVGVTINVALNGGLFQKAEQAKTQTQKETEQEELQLAVVASLNDDLEIPDANAIKNNLSEGWSVTGPENGVYTCISPKLNEFTVSETDKKITYEGISDGKTKEPKFYGVEYANTIANFYFYKDGIALFRDNKKMTWDVWTYTKNENQLTIMGMSATVSDDYNTVTIDGVGTFTRNDNITSDWDKEYAPAVICINSRRYSNDYYPDLSNSAFQEKGEYKTTIVIADGKYSVTDMQITFKFTGGGSLKEYKEGEDYLYNSSTGEITIFNLTEPLIMNISVALK